MSIDKLRVEIHPNFKFKKEDVLERAESAGWSDDPGQGVAVLLPDERGNAAYEVCNPMQFAPPIGFEPTPDIETLIRERVGAELTRLRDDEVIDSEEDANDFDVPDELPLSSVYEFVEMEPQAPALKPESEMTLEEKAKYHVDFMELAEREKLARRRALSETIQKQKAALRESEERAGLYRDEETRATGAED